MSSKIVNILLYLFFKVINLEHLADSVLFLNSLPTGTWPELVFGKITIEETQMFYVWSKDL